MTSSKKGSSSQLPLFGGSAGPPPSSRAAQNEPPGTEVAAKSEGPGESGDAGSKTTSVATSAAGSAPAARGSRGGKTAVVETAPSSRNLRSPAGPASAPPSRPSRRGLPRNGLPAAQEVLTVARLDRLIKRVLEGTTTDVRVRGEVSGLHRAGSGHCYFSLKDEKEDALIDCVMYRNTPSRVRAALRNGERVVLAGRVTLYAPRGRLQFIAEDLLQTGRGALLEALEKLKAKLASEGLFEAARKKPLPPAPRTVAVLTSRAGAAVHDVVRVAFRRGALRILLVPTPVQGATAPARIAEAIGVADKLPEVDVILVTRGGGSAEDLAAYNDESVVRAIAAAQKPVLSAVGHEIDVSLSDLAADARAATPSHAAEMLVPDQTEQRRALAHWRSRLRRALRHQLSSRQERLTRLRGQLGEPRRLVLEQAQRFDELAAKLERSMRRSLAERAVSLVSQSRRLSEQHPRRGLAQSRLALGQLQPRLRAAAERRLQQARGTLAAEQARLTALSPLAVLQRGYAIVQQDDGRVVRSSEELSKGQPLAVRFGRGGAQVEVTEISPPEPNSS